MEIIGWEKEEEEENGGQAPSTLSKQQPLKPEGLPRHGSISRGEIRMREWLASVS